MRAAQATRTLWTANTSHTAIAATLLLIYGALIPAEAIIWPQEEASASTMQMAQEIQTLSMDSMLILFTEILDSKAVDPTPILWPKTDLLLPMLSMLPIAVLYFMPVPVDTVYS